ncbi:MAG: PKD domain-containing protein, partial [Flavobacteriaceae bacterium]|nr:PKD domain-containing protein [Flavobacteriaceae bacterium]
MKKIILLLLLFYTSIFYSQRETDNWYFGRNAGVNFTSNKINTLTNSAMNTLDGTASLSDIHGNLLFYTNGETIWNKEHHIMENGDGLFGDKTNTQTSIIIPRPNRPGFYYVFYSKLEAKGPYIAGIYFSEIVISATYPLGKIIRKNQNLTHTTSEKLTAVHHADGKSIWLLNLSIEPDYTGAFILHKITESGISLPLKTTMDHIVVNKGQMKFSPDGKKIAIASYNNQYIYMYDFDAASGEITENQRIFLSLDFFHLFGAYGVEFSQDSKQLYASTRENDNGKIQYTILHLNLDSPPPFIERHSLYSNPVYNPGSLQLATNGKIYVSYYKSGSAATGKPNKYIDVINYPEKMGLESEYIHNTVFLENKTTYKGLPNFVQSYLRTRIITENRCVFKQFNFKLDSYAEITQAKWDFGDGSTANGLTANHTYTSPGEYTITTLMTMNGVETKVFKRIIVYALPDLIKNQELIQCDINNGLNFFNLTEIQDKISSNSQNELFIFYENEQDALHDNNPINDPVNYKSKSNPQTLFVKVITQYNCESMVDFTLKSIKVSLGNIPNKYTCEISKDNLNNSVGIFDLNEQETEIKKLFNLPNSTLIQFYPSLTDAQTKTNELIGDHQSSTTKIWVRTEDANFSCSGIEPIDLIVNELPFVAINNTYTICSTPDVSSPIILDGNSNNDRFEWRNSNGLILSTDQYFKLLFTGKFTLTIYKTENNIECSKVIPFNVILKEAPTFEKIVVDANSVHKKVTVSIDGNSSYEFSLDNISFSGNATTHTFNNISAGIHTV